MCQRNTKRHPSLNYVLNTGASLSFETYKKVIDEGSGKELLSVNLGAFAKVLSHNLTMHKDGRKAYGEMNETLMGLIKSFRDLSGKNVILICQQARMEDNESRIYFGPAMPGKTLAQWIPYATDLVGCIRVRKEEDGTVKRAFQFAEVDELYTAKNRGGLLDDYEPVDWGVVFKKMNAQLKSKKKEKKEVSNG